MPSVDGDTPGAEFVQRLESSVANWKSEIREYDAHLTELSGAVKSELRRALAELRLRWSEVKERVDELRSSGEETLDDARESALHRYRELVSIGQRVSEKILASSGHSAHTRYFLNPSPGGGWDLKKSGAPIPLRHFQDKRTALVYSSRYARRRAPSVLVVRRQDGTFQQTRTYGSVTPRRDGDGAAV